MSKPIAVVIPAFNEEEAIGKVIQEIPLELVEEIIVVDNNSSDQTGKVAKAAGAIVLKEERSGYGYACLKGIDYLSSNPPKYLAFLDGDYSDYPEQLKELYQEIESKKLDLVIGSRALGSREKGALTPQQVFGNGLATTLIRWFYGVKYTDLGPFRIIRFGVLQEMKMEDKTYGWTVEMQLKAAKMKYKTGEIPVNYRKRIGVSKVSGTLKGTILAGYKIIGWIFKYL